MANERCVHGMDSRFCAICNAAPGASGFGRSAAAGGAGLAEILQFLNHEQVRATEAAVAQVLGVPPRALGVRLGPRRTEASWIVNAETGLPTNYEQQDWDPALLSKSDIIRTGNELTLRLALWRRPRA